MSEGSLISSEGVSEMADRADSEPVRVAGRAGRGPGHPGRSWRNFLPVQVARPGPSESVQSQARPAGAIPGDGG